ncbi:hypothetical protein [Jiulongibacter sediminis]|uniref:Uncharacterized protein n=1 Tax=Jiulongibacter sediminis TaxID=1605367 RepID=A0A0P7BPX3_9BACT|nr:hypothetical protein [Jiulongibacter sediminis]KPM49184.1 hypothetical protein AFM12_00615 [Jiulongibacter sediminis]TBX26238.1 hypothetical protein TK44_00615 [Jiulongibacter sediminis]
MQEQKQRRSWYQKLKLTQKFKLNTALGFVLVALGALILAITGEEMTHHIHAKLHAFVGIVLLLGGLWFCGSGLRYRSQLDAIRIARRNRGGFQKKKKKND